MNLLENLRRMWTFYVNAHTKYDVHSPFISKLIVAMKEPLSREDNTKIQGVEIVRKKLLKDQRKISLQPMGAGSRLKENNTISVSQLAARSLSTPRQCLTYFRLLKWLQPSTILELGTSLGISTMYHHLAAPRAHLISIEGRMPVHRIAREIIAGHKKVKNIDLLQGLFDEHLENALTLLGKVDYVFIDGDHRGSSLIKYLQQILPHTHDRSIIVVHDIYWSDDMLDAWNEIITWPQIKASLDIYEMGVLIFNSSVLHQQNVRLISSWLKPWRQGFFC